MKFELNRNSLLLCTTIFFFLLPFGARGIRIASGSNFLAILFALISGLAVVALLVRYENRIAKPRANNSEKE